MKTLYSFFLAVTLTVVLVSCKSSSTSTPSSTNGFKTPVGTPSGTPSAKSIDASGGSVTSADGRLEVIIPASALSATTNISIQPITNQAPSGAGLAFSLTPEGQTFSTPITLAFHYKPEDLLGADKRVLSVATQKSDGIWYQFKSVNLDSTAGTVSITTPHFSSYALIDRLAVIPAEAEVATNGTQRLEIRIVSPAEDADPADGQTPMNESITLPSANDVIWLINGRAQSLNEDGHVNPTSASGTTMYTAPSTAAQMSNNPAAITAELKDADGTKLSLSSYIKVLDKGRMSGRISLSASVSGDRTYTESGIAEFKSKIGGGDFAYDIANVPVEGDPGQSRFANINDAAFGGSANLVEVHTRSYKYICDANDNRTVTDKTTTTQTFSSTTAGAQITGVGLQIDPDGTYHIAVGPSGNINAANIKTDEEHSGYCINPSPQTYTSTGPIPFSQYFIGYVAGPGEKLTGKIDPAHPNIIKGSFHGTDQLTMFSHGTETITLPLEYTITWDLTIGN